MNLFCSHVKETTMFLMVAIVSYQREFGIIVKRLLLFSC